MTLAGQRLLKPGPALGFVFQSPTLLEWRTVLDNPVPMAVWAALVMGFTLLGLAAVLVGLVFVVPMLGHASWYAYRDLYAAP